MSILSWNCRGFRNPQKVNALKKAIRLEDPIFVFLMEMKSNVDWMRSVRDRFGFNNSFVVPSNGLSGGLALFWKSEATVHVQNATLTYIDARVEGDGYEG